MENFVHLRAFLILLLVLVAFLTSYTTVWFCAILRLGTQTGEAVIAGSHIHKKCLARHDRIVHDNRQNDHVLI